MTTIATDGKTIAADGRMTANSVVVSDQSTKIFKLPGERACGKAGEASKSAVIVKALQQGDDLEELDFSGVCIVVIDGSDTVEVYEETCKPLRFPTPFAVGTGRELAYGAMDAGKSPVEAVKIACKRDVYSGGRVRSISVKPKA